MLRVGAPLASWLTWFSLVLGLWLMPQSAFAGRLDVERPGQREFVVDYADILDDETEQEIRVVAERLLDEHATPIVVVTIESMAEHGGARMDIETFARILFDQWGVGHPFINEQKWDTGILLVISEQDRKARIELGSGWAHEKDAEAQRIMNDRIVPAFKRGDYSQGTVAGVYALEAMARSKPLPPKIVDTLQLWLIYALLILLGLAILRSLITSGRDGWGWKLIVLVFTILGGILAILWATRGRRERSCSGGRRLGSFGGGRSGGGGATGSW